jgi:hypothetical protein
MKSRFQLIAMLAIVSALLSACGIFGCAGVGGNSGYAAGCTAGTRF